jgi:hypothetical protein
MALAVAVLVIAVAAWFVVSRYARYNVLESVQGVEAPVPETILDLGLASDGGLLALTLRSRSSEPAALDVMALDGKGAGRVLFTVVDPAKALAAPAYRVQQAAPSTNWRQRLQSPPRQRARPSAPPQLIEARLAPVAARVAALWTVGSETLLSVADGRGADPPLIVGEARQLALSPDGTTLALAAGDTARVLRVATAAPETLLAVSVADLIRDADRGDSSRAVGRTIRALAVSPGGRLAVADQDGAVSVVTPSDTAVFTLRAPGPVSRMAFLGEARIAVVGFFPDIHVLGRGESMRVPSAAGRSGGGVVGQDSSLVAYVPGQSATRYTLRTVRRTRLAVAVGVPLAAYALVAVLAVSLSSAARARRETAQARVGGLGTRPVLPLPEPPPELVAACAGGKAVLFAGAGLSAQAGYPTWNPFVDQLVRWAHDREFIDSRLMETLLQALASGQANSAAYTAVSTLQQTGHGAELQEYLKGVFGPVKGVNVPKVHRTLAELGFAAFLTHNLDALLERSLGPGVPVYTPTECDQALSALSQRSVFLLKLYGSIDRAPVLVAPAQYQSASVTNQPFLEFSQQLFVSRTLFFVGTSLSGITDYLESLTFHRTSDIRHFALVAIDEVGWEAKARVLLDRYGVHVLPFTTSGDFSEVMSFVDALVAKVDQERQHIGREQAARQDQGAIRRVTLRNIGAFEKLEIEIDEHVTVLLGDNGLGKSTILRAIGLALAGSDQESSLAAPLLRSSPSRNPNEPLDGTGQVMLETQGGKTYTTIIGRRGSEGVRIQFQPHSWQRGEGQLALGFPPLRSVSAKAVASPQILEDKPRPLPSDVLPIVSSDPDSRVSDLKQWLVSLDYRRRASNDQGRTDRMLSDFFSVVNEMLEGVRIDFKGLVVEGGEVRVVTEDGSVPLHSLSQGSVSMIGLIGVLLPRLYDVHGGSGNPRNQFAIALIDEIDAHMHPRWQQTLMTKLRRMFPHVQFIVTTHSPFIVAGREKSEIVRLRRDERTRQIVVEPTYADTKGVDVASLLTGYLFGLESPVDPETQEHLLERRRLVAAEKLTETEQRQLRELNVKLAGVIASPTADPEYNRFLRALGEREGAMSAGAGVSAEPDQEKLDMAKEVLAQLKSEGQVR